MNFLLDTNVVSEWVKLNPNPGLVTWLANTDEDSMFLSAVTVAELCYGIERMPKGRRRDKLIAWYENDLPFRFEGRILPIDTAVAHTGGKVIAQAEAAGRRVETMDAFLAATAMTHGLTLVTRNSSHFHRVVKSLLNPWT